MSLMLVTDIFLVDKVARSPRYGGGQVENTERTTTLLAYRRQFDPLRLSCIHFVTRLSLLYGFELQNRRDFL